ncbi:MAG: GAF domain-containing protein, partial [Pseudonocardia sp.]|nr:GAF domain-containing protein [Pseudonocardia sp.]
MTATDSGLSSLVTQLGRARASAMDVPVVLGSVCSALPGVLGVAGALLLLVDPPDGVPELTASDAHAVWIGETQQRTNMGPLAGALRTWRPMLTTDLSRIGPPTVAGAAAEYGLASSLVLPFDVDGDRVGVLQLLGEVQRPVEAVHAEMLRPLLDVLGARLADVRALRRAGASPPADPAAACTAAPDPTPSS